MMEYVLAPLLLAFYGLQVLFVIFSCQEAEEAQNIILAEGTRPRRLREMLIMIEAAPRHRYHRKERERFDWRKEGF